MIITDVFRWLYVRLVNGGHLKANNISRIRSGTEINAKNGLIIIGDNFSSQTNCHFVAVYGGELEIGDGVSFNRNCIVVARGITKIGNGTVFGPNVCIYDHNHVFNYEGVHGELRTGEITIGEQCWIGAGAIILKDTYIGDGCVVGAGTVVKGTIPPHSLVTMNRELKIEPIRGTLTRTAIVGKEHGNKSEVFI